MVQESGQISGYLKSKYFSSKNPIVFCPDKPAKWIVLIACRLVFYSENRKLKLGCQTRMSNIFRLTWNAETYVVLVKRDYSRGTKIIYTCIIFGSKIKLRNLFYVLLSAARRTFARKVRPHIPGHISAVCQPVCISIPFYSRFFFSVVWVIQTSVHIM